MRLWAFALTLFFFFPFILQDCIQDIRIGVSYLVTGTGVLNRVDDTELVQHLTHDDDTHPDCRKTGCHGPEATVGHRQRPQHHQDQVHHRRLRTNRGHNQYTHIETNQVSYVCSLFQSFPSHNTHPPLPLPRQEQPTQRRRPPFWGCGAPEASRETLELWRGCQRTFWTEPVTCPSPDPTYWASTRLSEGEERTGEQRERED